MGDVISLKDYQDPTPRDQIIELMERLLREKSTDPTKWNKELRDEILAATEARLYDAILRATKPAPTEKLLRLLDMEVAGEYCGLIDALDDVTALALPPERGFRLADLL
jgi:hypothetical protein